MHKAYTALMSCWNVVNTEFVFVSCFYKKDLDFSRVYCTLYNGMRDSGSKKDMKRARKLQQACKLNNSATSRKKNFDMKLLKH